MAAMRSRFIPLKRKTRLVPIPLERNVFNCVGNLIPAMGARNHVGIGLSYRPASLCSLAILISRLGSWNRFLAP